MARKTQQHAAMVQWQEQESGGWLLTLHPIQEAESEQELRPGYEIPRPSHNDPLPLVRFHKLPKECYYLGTNCPIKIHQYMRDILHLTQTFVYL